MHHQQLVAVGESCAGMARARHDLAVALDRDAALAQLQLGQESGNRGRALEPAGFAVDGDLLARRDA